MFLSDLHMHTWLSIDGSESVGAFLRGRAAAGAWGDRADRPLGRVPARRAGRGFRAALHGFKGFLGAARRSSCPRSRNARERYAGRLRILYGVELGQPQLDPVQTRAFLDAHRFDFVLASEHLNGDSKDYYTLDYTQVDIDALMRECFELELAVVRSGTADAIAHIDQPVRLMRGMAFDIGLTAYREQIAELLREMAARRCTRDQHARPAQLVPPRLAAGVGAPALPRLRRRTRHDRERCAPGFGRRRRDSGGKGARGGLRASGRVILFSA